MPGLSFVLHVSSSDSTALHPSNSPSSFIVELPYTIHLPGKWFCCVEGVYSYSTSRMVGEHCCVHLLMDIVSPSIAYGKEARIAMTAGVTAVPPSHKLELFPIGEGVARIERQSITRIRFDLVGSNLENCDFLTEGTIIVIRFSNSEWLTAAEEK